MFLNETERERESGTETERERERERRGNMELQGGWSKQIWLGLYLKLVAVVGFLIQILLIFFEISFRIHKGS